jgi:hypothetical protein
LGALQRETATGCPSQALMRRAGVSVLLGTGLAAGVLTLAFLLLLSFLSRKAQFARGAEPPWARLESRPTLGRLVLLRVYRPYVPRLGPTEEPVSLEPPDSRGGSTAWRGTRVPRQRYYYAASRLLQGGGRDSFIMELRTTLSLPGGLSLWQAWSDLAAALLEHNRAVQSSLPGPSKRL